MNFSWLARPHADAVRFVPFFVGINLIGGAHLPFFPAWLASVGFDPETTGLLMAAMGVVRVFTGPVLGIAADAFAARRLFIIALMLVAAASYAGYMAFAGFTFVVLFSLTSSAAFSAVGPLLEGITLRTAIIRGFDYGRVRLWGSVAFVAMNFIAGALITANGISSFLPILIAGGTASFLASLWLPQEGEAVRRSEAASIGRDALKLGTQPLFLLFVAAAGIGQACHSFYYAFGTLNWKALHYDPGLIGFLWALGVIAEIVLLSVSSRIVRRLGPIRLLLIGTGAGLVRWTALALSPPLWLLIPIQCLHAGTFCAVHLGTMHFILRAVPPHLVGTAQSIFAAISIGMFFSIGQYGSGLLFADFGSLGYLAMTAMSALAFGLSLLLGRLWNGGVLAPRG